MRLLIAAGVLLGVVSSACTPPAHRVQESKIEPAKLQCHNVQPTGSVLTRRVCTTETERKAATEKARTDFDAVTYRQRQEEFRRQMRGR